MTEDGRREQVLDLRIRLERTAAAAFDLVCGPEVPGRQDIIATRLLFVVGLVEPADRLRVHRLARLGGHVYKRSSDVLHGRVRGQGLPAAVVAEWRETIARLESVVGDAASSRNLVDSPRRADPA